MSGRVWEVCDPHRDVFERDLDPSMFAVSLYAVVTGTADPDYTEPERFFAKTFMTRSLENVLESVLARLLGLPGRGAPVIRLETPFGGGKTHTMVALYHLVRYPEAVEETDVGKRLRERLNLNHLPRNVRIAVLDGAAMNPQGWESGGLRIYTLWGELAYQLGGQTLYEVVREADEARVPPGQAIITDLLRSARPVLILMDEVMHFVAKAQGVQVGDTNLGAQTIAFLRELTAAVSDIPQVVLVLSLPASSLEVPAETRAQAEEMFQSIRKVISRTELIETPVAQDEVFGVLKRRLFQSVGDQRMAKRAVEAFRKYYETYSRFFPEKLRTPSYRKRMIEAYPFHPELVDLLYQRWGPHPQFQRTRGALRLMALVLRRLWSQRPGSAFLIQPHHIDLRDRYIRAEVARLLDGATFDAIITGDVLERASGVDRELGGEYLRERLAEGAATVAMLYSISAGTERHGCTEEELRVALLRPDINPTQVTEVLGRLRNRLWYLRYRDHRYFFTVKPNLNKIIIDFEQSIVDERIDQALREYLKRAAGTGHELLSVCIAPEDPEALNEPSRATLVLLPLEIESYEAAESWMQRALARITARNLLLFLIPEKGRLGELRATIRRLLALQNLQRAQTYREMDKEDQDEVRRQIKDAETQILALLISIYSRLFRPGSDGVEELKVTLKRNGKTLAEIVANALKEKGILTETLSPEYLKTLGAGQRSVTLSKIKTVLTGSPGQPIVSDPQNVIFKAIQEGVKQGHFKVRVGEHTFTQEVPEEVLKRPDAELIPVNEKEPEPVQTRERRAVVLEVECSGISLYPLVKLFEELQSLGGSNLKVHLTIKDESGKLRSKKDIIKDLLSDYSIPHEWKEK